MIDTRLIAVVSQVQTGMSGNLVYEFSSNMTYVEGENGMRIPYNQPMTSIFLNQQLTEMLEWYQSIKAESELLESHPILQKMYEQFQVMKALCIK